MGLAGILGRLLGSLTEKQTAPAEAEAPDNPFVSTDPNNDFLKLNAMAPLASEPSPPRPNGNARPIGPDTPPTSRSIVRREAVLGNNQRVAGYVFRLRFEVNQRVRASSTSIQRLYDDVLLRNLQIMEIQRLLEHRLAFIEVAANSLDMPVLEALQPQGTVYVVGTNAELTSQPDAWLSRLSQLKKLGFRIGLHGDGVDAPEMTPFLELADFLFIDVGNNDIPTIHHQIDAPAKRIPPLSCVATNIQTLEEFNVCSRLPFSFYQGSFITSREKWDAPRMDAGRIKILELLNKLRRDAEVAELTAVIKQDPALSFKLLRYINSPGIGLLHKASTLEQALIVLGRQQFYRWLTLLLFTSGQARGLDWAIMENALVRARLAELLARDALSASERDELFVAGVFSLLDVVMAIPMADVLKQVSLPPAVNEVLLEHRGKYAPYLELAIACEQYDEANIAELSQAIGLDSRAVNGLHVDALIWAQQVSE
ncbi:MAG: HDOD domain-containing protein [Thiobacillus sp.]